MGKSKGLMELITHAIDRGASAVESVHMALLKERYEKIRAFTNTKEESALVQSLEELGTTTVYGAIRCVNKGAGLIAREVAGALEARAAEHSEGGDDEPPSSQRYALPLLNGVVGDFLERQRNPLTTSMALLHHNTP